MHLKSPGAIVNGNNPVSIGQIIGYSGATGQGVTGPHLHFEMRFNTNTRNYPMNPLETYNTDDKRGSSSYPSYNLTNNNPLYKLINGKYVYNLNFIFQRIESPYTSKDDEGKGWK